MTKLITGAQKEFLDSIQGMNRHQRRAYAKLMKLSLKTIPSINKPYEKT